MLSKQLDTNNKLIRNWLVKELDCFGATIYFVQGRESVAFEYMFHEDVLGNGAVRRESRSGVWRAASMAE